ncbi:MAG: hypothetical protein ABIK62_01700 [candidate division WOR-3 bacterium]
MKHIYLAMIACLLLACGALSAQTKPSAPSPQPTVRAQSERRARREPPQMTPRHRDHASRRPGPRHEPSFSRNQHRDRHEHRYGFWVFPPRLRWIMRWVYAHNHHDHCWAWRHHGARSPRGH